MVEYGQGVGQATGVAGGGGSGGSTDLTSSAAAFVGDVVDQVSALPPEGLLLLVVAVFVGLIILRKAF
jgi:hypothetical protein